MGKRKQKQTAQSIAAAVRAAMSRFYYVPFFTDFGFKTAWLKCKLFPRIAVQILLNLKVAPLQWNKVRNEFLGATFASKSGIFDVICQDERKGVYILEMQAKHYKFVVPRVVFYTSQEYCSLIPKGKSDTSFGNLPPVYCICIIKGKFLPGKDYHSIYLLKNQHGEILYPGMEIHFFELGKFPILRKNWRNVKTDEEKLLYTMKYAHTINGKDPAVKPDFWEEKWMSEVLSELELAKLSPQERAIVEMALVKEASIREADKLRLKNAKARASKKSEKTGKEKGIEIGKEIGIEIGIEQGKEKGIEIGIEQGKEKGIEIGIEQGKEENNIFAIRNMTKLGFTAELIAGILGIPEEYVLEIQKQLLKEPEIMRLVTEGKLDEAQIAKQLVVSTFLVELVKNELQPQN